MTRFTYKEFKTMSVSESRASLQSCIFEEAHGKRKMGNEQFLNSDLAKAAPPAFQGFVILSIKHLEVGGQHVSQRLNGITSHNGDSTPGQVSLRELVKLPRNHLNRTPKKSVKFLPRCPV